MPFEFQEPNNDCDTTSNLRPHESYKNCSMVTVFLVLIHTNSYASHPIVRITKNEQAAIISQFLHDSHYPKSSAKSQPSSIYWNWSQNSMRKKFNYKLLSQHKWIRHYTHVYYCLAHHSKERIAFMQKFGVSAHLTENASELCIKGCVATEFWYVLHRIDQVALKQITIVEVD